jgi:hypothetical protein
MNFKDPKFVTEEEIEKSGGIVYDPSGDEIATPESLPDPNEILDSVINILEFMNTPEMVELKNSDRAQFDDTMEEKFLEFSSSYYGIFRMIIDGEDITPLYAMLSIISKVKSGGSTMEEAEKNVGTYLTKFLPPEIVDKMEKGILTDKDIKVIEKE